MKQFRKKIRLAVMIVGLSVGALYLTPWVMVQFIGSDTITHNIKAQIESTTGRKIQWDKSPKIHLNWKFSPSLHFTNVKLSNTKWADNENLFEIGHLSVSVDLISFMHKKVALQNLYIKDGHIYLAMLSSDKNNWSFPRKDNQSQPLTLSIGDATVKNISIHFTDQRIDKTQTFHLPKAKFKTDHLGVPNYIYAKLNVNQQRIEINSSIVKENDNLRLTDLVAKINQNVLRGNLSLNLIKYQLMGTFHTHSWAVPAGDTPTHQVISDFEFPAINLSPWTGQIKLHLNEVNTQQLAFEKVFIQSKYQHPHINTTVEVKEFSGGEINANVQMTMISPPQILLHIDGKNINTQKMLASLHKDTTGFSNGVTQLNLELKGQGQSLKQALASATGEFLLQTKQLQIQNLEQLKSSILAQVMYNVYPSRKHTEATTVECLVGHFIIDQGIAKTKKGVGLESSALYLQGSGQINLATEALEFTVKPLFPKKIKVPIGTSTNYVKITGTLSEPKLSANPLGIMKEGGTIAAAIATSGISLLAQGVLNTATTDPHPCQTAIEMKN